MNSLIFDRTNADVTYAKEHQSDNNFLKGAYNYTDLNRIEEWCEQIATELTNAGYSLSITTKTDWDMDDFPTQAELERIRSNVAAIKSKFFATTNVPSNLNNMTYTKANDLEKVLNEIWNNLYGTENYYVYSGVARAGQNRTWQNRFRRLYRPKEYLQSSGTQYIDTGVSGAVQVILDIELLETSENTNYSIIWAENESSPYDTNGVRCSQYQGGWFSPFLQLGNGSIAGDTSQSVTTNTRYLITADTNPESYYMEANGVTLVQGTSSGYHLSTYNLFLFANNHAETPAVFGKIKLYSCKIYQNNVLVRDFIPVITTEPCLLDRVSGVFYYNQGTGTFG